MRYLHLLFIAIVCFSCKDDDFNATLVEGPAPSEVKSNLQITSNNPVTVIVSPSADGATAFEVDFGVPNQTPQLIGIQKELEFVYPDDQEYTISIKAIAANDKSTTVQFPVEQTAFCPKIVNPAISFESNEDFFTFNGVAVEIVANPDLSKANPEASNVLKVTNGGFDFEGFGSGLSDAVDFSNDDKRVKLKAWSESEVVIRTIFKAGVDGARGVEVEVTHTGSGWEELTFDFKNGIKTFVDGGTDNFEAFVPTGKYGEIQFFVEPGKTTAGIFYLDDIGLCE